MAPSPLHFARSGEFWGEGGVSGACPGESSKPGHPKGRKRRSGWSARTDTKGRTRELACDEFRCGGWFLVLSADRVEGELTFVRALASWCYLWGGRWWAPGVWARGKGAVGELDEVRKLVLLEAV